MSDLISWPDTLPRPTFEGYAVEPVDSVLRTEMESGPARQRRRFTHTPTRIPVRWRFSSEEMGIFESWLEHKAEAGGAWFTVDLLGGQGMTAHEARIMGTGSSPYKATAQRGGPGEGGVRWIVTSTLEVRERPVLIEEALDLFLSEDSAGLLSAMDELNKAIHSF